MRFKSCLLLFVSCMLLSCSYNENENTSSTVQLIFIDTPNQMHTSYFGTSLSGGKRSTISYIDSDGNIACYSPSYFGRDTLQLPTVDGYIEIKYVYQAIEDRYYRLKAGDVIEVHHDGYKPYFTSMTDTSNTLLYNFLYEKDSPLMHESGFTLPTVINDIRFRNSYVYFSSTEWQRKYPGLGDAFAAYYYDLDSLSTAYAGERNKVLNMIESMDLDNEYREFYLNVLGVSQCDMGRRLNDSILLRQITNYDAILSYPQGETIPERFQFIIDDTLPSPLAKRQMLEHYLYTARTNRTTTEHEIRDLVDLYVEHTGDTVSIGAPQPTHISPGLYDISAVDLDLREVDINAIIEQNHGKLIFLDMWASWCPHCIEGIRSIMDKSHLMRDNKMVIYLSVDSDIDQWTDGVKSLGLPRDNCYLVTNRTKSEFLSQIRLSSIPRYLIIAPDGKLLSADVPSPKDADFITLLDEIYKQHSQK